MRTNHLGSFSFSLLIAWLGSWGAFLALAWLVRRGSTTRFDVSLESKVAALTPTRLERLGDPLTALGMAEITLGLAVLLAVATLVLGWYRFSLAVSLVWLSVPIELAFKWFLGAQREDLPAVRSMLSEAVVLAGSLDVAELAHAPGSFPSGHVARTAFLAGLVTLVLLAPRIPRSARLAALPLVGFALGVAVAMGLTRVTTGQHTPADVVGGYLLAVSLLLPVPLLLGWRGRRGGVAGSG